MTEERKPVISPDEWRNILKHTGGEPFKHDSVFEDTTEEQRRWIAAIALYGYFSWEDVDQILDAAGDVARAGRDPAHLHKIADLITALLPPRFNEVEQLIYDELRRCWSDD